MATLDCTIVCPLCGEELEVDTRTEPGSQLVVLSLPPATELHLRAHRN